MIQEPTFRGDGAESTLSSELFNFFLYNYLFFFSFCFVVVLFLIMFFSPWLVSLYSYCWPITASQGFCDKRISNNVHIILVHSSTVHALYIEDIRRWREDMNFMFEWQEQ